VAAKERLLEVFKRQGKHASSNGLPPGQHMTPLFPVLDLGIQPQIDLSKWKLEVFGAVKYSQSFSLAQLQKLETKDFTADFHCVTTWSRLGVHWTGVPFKAVLEQVQPMPEWSYLLQHGADGYSTNVARADVEAQNVFIAFALEGKPIPKEHGYIRMIIPHLYAWKGSKFLTKLEFLTKDKPGFWETRGYHNHGDPWKEERYG